MTSNPTLTELTVRAYRNGARYIVHHGGTRSGKTYANLKTLATIAGAAHNRVISVVSETFPHLRRGAIRDFQQLLASTNSWHHERWSKSDMTYTMPRGSIIEFFSADSPGKVHGPQRDILFLNEAQNIPADTARHLMVRTSGAVFIDLNPTHRFWVHDLEGDHAAVWIHSTYNDNAFLSPEQVAEIERGKLDPNWWRVYGLGLVGQVEGLVFPDWQQVDSLPDGGRTAVGLDFGYSVDPTAVVRVVIKGDELYLDQLVYEAGLHNEHIANRLKAAGVDNYTDVWADSSEPKSIDALHMMGWNIKPVVKGADSVSFGLAAMRRYRIFVTKTSIDLIRELRNYTYKRDKGGRWIGQPIDLYNHAIDAARYAVMMMQPAVAPAKAIIPTTNNRRF